MLFNSKYRWVDGQASSIQLVGRKRRGRLDMGYESWGQIVQCEMLEYFEVARDIYCLWNDAYSVEKHEVFDEGLEPEVDEYLYSSGIKELFSEISVYQVELFKIRVN